MAIFLETSKSNKPIIIKLLYVEPILSWIALKTTQSNFDLNTYFKMFR